MSVDCRTRLQKDIQALARDAVFDAVIPDAIAVHGALAARGVTYQQLPSLGLDVDGRGVTLGAADGALYVRSGTDTAGVVVELAADALSDLVQDVQSTMGLAMTSRVRIAAGAINDWIGWEPALRALFDGRKVHETGDVTFTDLDGGPLDLSRTFTVDDDREEMAHFLAQAGFLHLRQVFDRSVMDAIGADIDECIGRATPDDGESWWAEDATGTAQAVRVLFFYEKSAALREAVADERYQWIGDLTGDGHQHKGGGEGLVKPLGIVRGLSDLPWHKDCGQGKHAYMCSALTCGISITGADRVSGALGVIPGSHRANTMATGRDPNLDLVPRTLETETGDVTVHCSDTLHRAHPPVERPRKVVYSGFGLAPLPGDEAIADPRYSRDARADLSSVQDRIEAADNPDDPRRYQARRRR
ncbi:MAG: phytanoyl-CoA dioxygenase family protein [Acidimicrobiia bacterium]|nr:phytanoyl-CoA dioxygenase family protein [Acidimicrobiia bacterium]